MQRLTNRHSSNGQVFAAEPRPCLPLLGSGMDMGRICKPAAHILKTSALRIVLATVVLAAALAGSPAHAQSSSANLPPGPGRDLFAQTCSQCHDLGLATGKRRSADE